MWSRIDYEKASQNIGDTFVKSGGSISINELAVKVAEDASLNEDGIKTLVCLANVAAFEGLFNKRAEDLSEDRMIDFVVGNPEEVILTVRNKLANETSIPKVAHYCQKKDLYLDLPKDTDTMKKEASTSVEVSSTIEMNPLHLIQRYKEAQHRLSMEAQQNEVAWENAINKAASCVLRGLGKDKYLSFEKRAAAYLSDPTYALELHGLSTKVGHYSSVFKVIDENNDTFNKIASNMVVDSLKPEEERILKFVKEANAARSAFETATKGMEWVISEISKIGQSSA